MFNLVIKDLLLQKKRLVFIMVYLVLMTIGFQQAKEILMIIIAVGCCYVMVTTSVAYDDKSNSDLVFNSLPLTKGEIVFAKYISLFIYIILSIVVFIFMSFIQKIFVPNIKIYPISIEVTSITVFIAILMNCIYYPLYFKFGYIKTNYINMAMYFLIGYGTFWIVEFIKDKPIGIWIRDMVISSGKPSTLLIGTLLTVASILVVMISYTISLQLYKRREF